MSKSSSTNYPNGFLKILSHLRYMSKVQWIWYHSKTNQLKQGSLGGYSSEVPPLPIPNREVKLTNADGTAYLGGRVGSRLFKEQIARFAPFLFVYSTISIVQDQHRPLDCSSATILKVNASLCTIPMALYPKIKRSRFLDMALIANLWFTSYKERLISFTNIV